MKKILFLLFLCFCFSSCGKNNENVQDISAASDSMKLEVAKNSVSEKDSSLSSSYKPEAFIDERLVNYDTISLRKISLKGIYLGDLAKKVIKILGKPDSMVNTKNEMGGYEYVNYWYSKSHFSIHNGVVEGFDIVDKRYSFDNIKVGDGVKVFSKKYPKSYKNQVGVSEDEFVIKLFITSSNEGDYYCPDLIDFIIKNGRIESFHTWTAW